MIINFITPTEAAYRDEPMDSPGQLGISDNVNFEIGEIILGTPKEEPGVPQVFIDLNEDMDAWINQSAEVEVNAWLNWSYDLTQKPSPPILSFLPCQAIIRVRPIAYDNIFHEEMQITPTAKETISFTKLKDNGTLSLNFNVDTDRNPNNLMFLVNYFLVISPMGFTVNHERAGDSDFNYIIWHPV